MIFFFFFFSNHGDIFLKKLCLFLVLSTLIQFSKPVYFLRCKKVSFAIKHHKTEIL